MWQIVPVGLAAACVVALVTRDDRRGGLVNVLALNWAACSIGAIVTGECYPVTWFAAVDWLSALAIVIGLRIAWEENSLAEILVAVIYGAQLVCHGWQNVATNPLQAEYDGYWFLYYAGLAQLAAAFVWIGHGFSRRLDLPWRGVSRSHAMRLGVPSARNKGTQ